ITLYEKELNRLLNHFQLDSYITDDQFKRRLLKKTHQFHSYYLQVINKDKINADIHLITSKDSDSQRMKWDRLTTGTFNLYQGAGEHIHMLDGSALQKNAGILENILNRIP
ncbi:MAG: hypothetical protein GY950_06980, partial [bacterium]|nr:hypothetical protein [bacterium]